MFGIRSPLVAAVVQAAVQVVLKMNSMDFMRMVDGGDVDAQGASCGWWGWMEEHLVATVTAVIIITIINNIIISKVTDLKKEWKGRVKVRMERTETFRFSLFEKYVSLLRLRQE